MLGIAVDDGIPAGTTLQEGLTADAPGSQGIDECIALLSAGFLRVVQETVHIQHQLGQLCARTGTGGGNRTPGVFEEMLLNVHHVVRDGVMALAVGLLLTADEQHRESQLRQPQDQLVDPARHAPAHIGPGSLEQQADIDALHVGNSGFLTHNQYLAKAAKGGRCNSSAGIVASMSGISS